MNPSIGALVIHFCHAKYVSGEQLMPFVVSLEGVLPALLRPLRSICRLQHALLILLHHILSLRLQPLPVIWWKLICGLVASYPLAP